MQSHLDNSGRSFGSMVQAEVFGGPPSHPEFLPHNGSPGSDFAHLLTNHNPPSHHNNNNNHHTINANNSPTGPGGAPEGKPKKQPPPNGKKTKGRVKIKMEFIDNKLRRYTTFSKRKTGIMKKAYELSTLTGTQVMLLVASETGHVYTFATRKLQPMITSEAGKALIQTCLNSPDPPNSGSDTQRMSATGYEETELTYAADPNASDHGDTKEDESESGSSDGDDPKEVPPLLPLSNGLLPANLAALLASASTAAGIGGSKGGLSIDFVPASMSSRPGSTSGTSPSIASFSSISHTASSKSRQSQSTRIKREPTK